MKTIALSGATGFLGCHLLPRLLGDGHTVIALARRTPQQAVGRLHGAAEFANASEAITAALAAGQLRLVQADLEQDLLGLDSAVFHQLAGEVDEVWHCAATTDMHAPLEQVVRVNVEGTRRMLALAAAGSRVPRFVHISTAFVAGDRREGVVAEEDLDSSYGFVTPYEESKYLAEVLVRSWATNGRRALVLRPSTLLTDRPPAARGPRGSHAGLRWALGRLAARGPQYVTERFGAQPDAHGRIPLRFPGRPDGLHNVAPVDYAADSVVRLAREDTDPGTVTCHVVHPVDTPVGMWVEAIAAQAPWVRAEIVEHSFAPSDLEQHLVSLHPGGHRFGLHRRRYERTALDRAEARDGIARPAAPDAAFLRAALSSPARARSTAGAGA
ncbi:SDR family oxidoreductase [Streptomyces sp. NPDC053493]|uniref:SDR family oxidoreductase n=1 Tax=Streptomyces sp. NPDC053493 TaxID=3365705 RepID=UPI0037D082B7